MQGKTSSQVNLRPKFHLHNSKLEVYAQNAIKRSNVKGFVNQNIRTSEKLNMQNNQNKNLSHHLLHLKNSCCDLKKDIYSKQNTTIKLKDQTSFTQEKVKQLLSQRQKLEERITNLTKDVELVSTKKQSTFHSFKTYEHILWRMKKDQITNQIRKNNLQKQIVNLQKDLKLIDNKLYSMKQYEELSLKGLRQAQIEIQKQNIERQKKVNEMNFALQQKKISEAKKQERHMQTKSIQEMAAGDLQDVELIRMKKFFEVQLFLRILLRDKMERLKTYYEPYEIAFLKIKAQTSAKDASALKTQFFNFETQFQEKTAWIKYLEEEMASLEAQKKQLNEDLINARQAELDLLDEYESKKPENEKNQNNSFKADRQHISQKSLDAELKLMKLKQWTSLQSKRIPSGQNSQTDVNSLTANFGRICDYLLELKNKG